MEQGESDGLFTEFADWERLLQDNEPSGSDMSALQNFGFDPATGTSMPATPHRPSAMLPMMPSPGMIPPLPSLPPPSVVGVAGFMQSTPTSSNVRNGVQCPYCGARAINLGGAKRGEKYTYMCEDTDNCGPRWSQLRVPDVSGDLDITVSNRAVGDEQRRSGLGG
jgi:hypothetical protein|eukprot:4480187-Prymnesium_polylepis.1